MNGRKMTRRVRLEHWSGVIRECQNSGQTIRGYCKANGINEKAYYYWQKELREVAFSAVAEPSETAIAPAFAEVSLGSGKKSVGTIIVRLSDAEIEISGNVAPNVAASVIGALREKC